MKAVCFTVADNNYLPYAKMLERSFKHFHPDVDFIIFGEEEVKQIPFSEPYYRNKAYFGKQLAEKYDTVLNIDADSIVVDTLREIFESPFEVGSVLNNFTAGPDPLQRPIIGLDRTNPAFYLNAGLVCAKTPRFWDWWAELNQRHFYGNYQFREQDTMNMIFQYGDLKTVNFDESSGIYGLWLNGFWPEAQLENEKVVLPEDILGVKKTWKVLHWAGGANAPKMNYRTRFPEVVADKIAELVS